MIRDDSSHRQHKHNLSHKPFKNNSKDNCVLPANAAPSCHSCPTLLLTHQNSQRDSLAEWGIPATGVRKNACHADGKCNSVMVESFAALASDIIV
jgi:hypothetical protein